MTSWLSLSSRTASAAVKHDENAANSSSTILKSFVVTKRTTSTPPSANKDVTNIQDGRAFGGVTDGRDDNSRSIPSPARTAMELEQMKEQINQWGKILDQIDSHAGSNDDSGSNNDGVKQTKEADETSKMNVKAEIDPAVILQVMNNFKDDVALMITSLQLLQHVLLPEASSPSASPPLPSPSASFDGDSKLNFATIINHIEVVMKSNLQNASKECLHLQALCTSCLAIIAQHYASCDLKNDHLLPITVSIVVRQIMTKYVVESPDVQRYSCQLLRYLSNPLLQELVAAGCVLPILNSMKYHPYNASVQEHGNATLYNLLTICLSNASEAARGEAADGSSGSTSNGCCCIIVDGMIMTTSNIASIVVEGMMENKTDLQVQKYGLLVLTRLLIVPSQLSTSKANEMYILSVTEQILSHGNGLHVILKALSSSASSTSAPEDVISDPKFIDLQNVREEIIQIACSLLKHISRQSANIQLLLIKKDGISVLLNVMRTLSDGNVNIHDPIMATIRNLCSVVTIPPPSAAAGSIKADDNNKAEDSSNIDKNINSILHTTMMDNGGISCILATMTIHHSDAAIQAYGCDALGRLLLLSNHSNAVSLDLAGKNTNIPATASTPNYSIHKTIYVENGINVALSAMIEHRTHSGVQDRAIMYLLQLSYYDAALNSMKTKKLKTTITNRTMGVLSTTKYITITFLEFLQETMLPSNKQLAQERLKKLILKIST